MSLPRKDKNVEVVEQDELHTYIGQKKTTAGYGLLLIELEKGLSLLSAERQELKNRIKIMESNKRYFSV